MDAVWRRDLYAALLSRSPSVRSGVLAYRRTAAAVWGLDGVRPGVVELAAASGRPRSPAFNRVRSIAPSERQVLNGLPLTSVSRTLIDLGQVADADTVERALESALRERHTSVESLTVMLATIPFVPGTGALRRLLTLRPSGLPPTESDAETLFAQLSRRAGLPEPQRQFLVPTAEGTFRVDFAWPAQRLAAEVDGAAAHGSRDALARDLRRQNRLLLSLAPAGWLLLRFTWDDLVNARPAAQTAAKLREAWGLSRAGVG